MDREHIKGTAKKVTGAIKDKAGQMTDDKDLQAEGKMDKAEGSARKVAGDIKDAVKHATEEQKFGRTAHSCSSLRQRRDEFFLCS